MVSRLLVILIALLGGTDAVHSLFHLSAIPSDYQVLVAVGDCGSVLLALAAILIVAVAPGTKAVHLAGGTLALGTMVWSEHIVEPLSTIPTAHLSALLPFGRPGQMAELVVGSSILLFGVALVRFACVFPNPLPEGVLSTDLDPSADRPR